LIESLNPVLSVFDGHEIRQSLQPVIDDAWRHFEEQKDEESLLHLMDVFWWVKQTDSLIYVKSMVDKMPSGPAPIGDVHFAMSNQLPATASVLSILDNFRNAEASARRTALKLLVEYVQKRPSDLSLVMRILLESYGMTHRSDLTGFDVERDVLDVLWDSCDGGQNEFCSKMFLAVAEPLLHTYFHSHESRSSLSITIIKFEISPSTYLTEFRNKTWERIIRLYEKTNLRPAVLQLLEKHVQSRYHLRNAEIVQSDAGRVQPFLRTALDPTDYRHCVLVNDYLSMLDEFEIEVDEELRKCFSNETYALSELLVTDRAERREMGWEEYQSFKRQRLAAYTSKYDETDFAVFFERCIDIINREANDHHRWEIHQAIVDVLLTLADRDGGLYSRVLDRCLHSGNQLGVGPWALVPKLIETCGAERSYEILSRGEYPSKNAWLFGYFMALPPEVADEKHLTTLYSLYESAPSPEILRGFDYFLKFERFDSNFFVKVTRILVNRSTAEPAIGLALAELFSRHSTVSGRLKELFSSDPALLQQAYFAGCLVDQYPDYDGTGFNALIDLNPNFGAEWVRWMFEQNPRISHLEDQRNYSFLWRRDDYAPVVQAIAEEVFASEKQRFLFPSYLEVYFILRDGDKDLEALNARQDEVLDDIIAQRHDDLDFMRMLFSVISNLSPERRRERLRTFLRFNSDFDAFTKIDLEPNSFSWSGSMVPLLQRRTDFLETLIPLMATVELLHHKQYVEHRIQRLRLSIEKEKKSDFMDEVHLNR
jgi:hypothetical protein